MAVRGYLGIHAEVPTAQNLHSASRGGGHRQKAEARRPASRPGSKRTLYPVGTVERSAAAIF
ncbi:hypothetical protein ELQ88_11100 [Pseudomonas sp. MPC6]|nr:hypothetical protein ELQ88_11100 [Pseudomonas sp. MPC6]